MLQAVWRAGSTRCVERDPTECSWQPPLRSFPYRTPIVVFMAVNGLLGIYPFREFAETGGLVLYATNFHDLFRRAADYVDKVLKGAQAGELPVQQATTFELLVNLTTAKALGLTIPPAILARADEVIE
jgi:putative ABC transport system substrate-binding protein